MDLVHNQSAILRLSFHAHRPYNGNMNHDYVHDECSRLWLVNHGDHFPRLGMCMIAHVCGFKVSNCIVIFMLFSECS